MNSRLYLTSLLLLTFSLPSQATTNRVQEQTMQAVNVDSLQADSLVRAFHEKEQQTISQWQRQSKLHLTSFIAGAVEGALRGMMAQWLPDDKGKIVTLYNKVCGSQLPASAMKAIIAKDVNSMMRELNTQRQAFVTGHPQAAAQSGLSRRAGGFSYPIVRQKVDCPIDDLLQMHALQGQVDWMSLGLTADKAVPNGCGLQLLKGANLIDSNASSSADLRRVAPIINRIAKQMAWYISKSVYATVDHSYDVIRKNVK